MSSRASILAAIKSNLPELSPLPKLEGLRVEDGDGNKAERFIEQAMAVSSNARFIKSMLIGDYLNEHFNMALGFCSRSKYWIDDGNIHNPITDPHELEDCEIGIIDARFGVIENGAVWVDEENIQERALPFICQHLVVILKMEDLVENMHDAYALITKDPMPRFGLFIGGPSKTADIEQALVLGAHGPLTNTILLIE